MMRYLILILWSCIAIASPGELPGSFEASGKLADEHEKDERSKEYKNQLLPHYAKSLQGIFSKCIENTNKPDTQKIDFVVVLGTNGTVVSSWHKPKTNISMCLISALEGSAYPKPPFAPYYAKIEMSFVD